MKPLILNRPAAMARLRVITVKDTSEATLKLLQKIGVLHVEEAKELQPVDKVAIENEKRQIGELLTFVNRVLSYIPQKESTARAEDFDLIYSRPLSELGGEVRQIHKKVNNLAENIARLDDEEQKLRELRRSLEPLARQDQLRLSDLDYDGEYLVSRVFVLSHETYKSLPEGFATYLFENAVPVDESEIVCHVIAEAKDQKVLESQIGESGGKILSLPDENITVKEFLGTSESRLYELASRIDNLRKELEKKAGDDLDKLILFRAALAAESERLSVLEMASEAKYVNLIEGWIPQNEVETLTFELRQAVKYIYIDSRPAQSGEEPPSKLDNMRGIRPFQVIIDLFGTPKYGEWDPTPIVAYFFALFFGIMTNDVVYAIGIMLLAKFVLPKLADNPYSEGFVLFQRVLYISAAVGLVVGVLSGSYLGDNYQLLGIESMALVGAIAAMFRDPVQLILAAVGIGFVHVNIAHVLALMNAIKAKAIGAIVGKIGIFTMETFAILYAIVSLFDVNLAMLNPAMGNIFLYLMLVGILLIIVGTIMQSKGLGVILWIFEITGVLGDVLSYSRLAGVALATFYLASSFRMLALVLRGLIPGTLGLILGTVIAIFVLIFGHIINLALSAITAFVHSLRLCFVEFMFKFYEGGGRQYSPFKLRTRLSLSVEEKT